MSNNVVSRQYQSYDITQIVRKEHMSEVSDSLTSSHGFQNIDVSNGVNIQTEATEIGLDPQSSSLPIKRKVETTEVAVPNKRVGSSSLKKHTPVQSKVISTVYQNPPALNNKKLMRNDSSSSGKSGSWTPKGRNTESNDSVRSKLRDQIAAALSLVLQNKEETTNGDSASQNLSAVVVDEEKKSPVDSGNSQVSTDESSKELRSSIFPEEDGLFVKDDLLLGNGLSWAYEYDMGSTEMLEVHHDSEKMADVGLEDSRKQSSPEELAWGIEAELFKLFCGVNKKYKEKGRSLVFNLKDRNNPELRERVMSGVIPPDRLCSMTAEELASKELSEWRMAKAEELAQMVVLPDDTDFTQRRLVKKNHKGEYQVDFEQDVGDATKDVSGVDPFVAVAAMEEEEEVNPTTGTENNKSENQEISGSLVVIPSDGTDLMHGMMVDELKDDGFLPPIISLDDFMESLNAEPPFEDLQADDNVLHSNVSLVKEEESQVCNVLPPPLSVSVVGDTPETTKVDETDVKQQEVHMTSKPNEKAVVREIDMAPKRSVSPDVQPIDVAPKTMSPKIEHIWAGIMQLSISSSITTFGVFKSGEKTSTMEWSSSLEIKGRVKVDAFEKFIKDLPNSRTRAVMVLHLVLKDKSSETEKANLAEAVESYVSDERLGYAEPANGVELYVCPPHEKMLNVLGNYTVNHRDDFLSSSENGLIGIVVWRKAPITTTTTTTTGLSPNSSTHHKHTISSSSSSSSTRHEIKDGNVIIRSSSILKPPPSQVHVTQPPPSDDDDDDDDDSDIPPGFGPATTTRDDDDLPEFNFAGNMNPMHQASKVQQPPAHRPVDQLRQLIYKYGQNDPGVGINNNNNNSLLDNKRNTSIGIAIEPWNDDDDDMPEWRPNAAPLTTPTQPFSRPLQHGYGNQHVQQHHVNVRPVMSPSPRGGGWQVQPVHGRPPGNFGNTPSMGGLPPPGSVAHAGQRQDGSRSRGF